ncbi:MAG: ABC-F family ATP-binding cassette domain-containing protein, partial [Candidatus Pacebacteria bacterium]|nr:ABC-F family ATP-binding cassette domain-containing protein [Candidatus Paceibacterota bacterium]
MFNNDIVIKSKPVEGSLVILSKVSKKFGTELLFSGIDLVVNGNDRIAIVGANGMGKSTLVKIIMKQEEIESGDVQNHKDLSIGYLPQETHWNSLDNSIFEEMISADERIYKLIVGKRKLEELMSDTKRADIDEKMKEYGEIVHDFENRRGYEYEEYAEEVLEKFNFPESDWERKVSSLSGGEKTRLALAKIILQNPNILILDEPTNHLDLDTIDWLEKFLGSWNGAILAISHDKRFLDSVCDKTFELQRGGLEKYFCNYSGYLEERNEREQRKAAEYKIQQKYLKEQ